MNKTLVGYLTAAGLLVLAFNSQSQPENTRAEKPLVVEDFRKTSESTLGTKWQFFTDGVMGGLSEGKALIRREDKRNYLHLSGKVRLENNGGFIQARLPLATNNKSLDGSGYTGVRLKVKGNGESYAVHLRTSATVLPWQFYSASFETTGEWVVIYLPFKDFQPESLKSNLSPSKLKSIAVVAIKKKMIADVSVAEISLYP